MGGRREGRERMLQGRVWGGVWLLHPCQLLALGMWWLSDLRRTPPLCFLPRPAQAVHYKLSVTPAHRPVIGYVCLPSQDKDLFLPPQRLVLYLAQGRCTVNVC